MKTKWNMGGIVGAILAIGMLMLSVAFAGPSDTGAIPKSPPDLAAMQSESIAADAIDGKELRADLTIRGGEISSAICSAPTAAIDSKSIAAGSRRQPTRYASPPVWRCDGRADQARPPSMKDWAGDGIDVS